MANILEYILSLKDQISGNLQKIGVNSDSALNKFAHLEKQSKETDQLMKDFGGSVGSLREKLNLLRSERDWIPKENIQAIRTYNGEIKKLEKNINKLENINGSRLKKWGQEAFQSIPGANLITNPLVLAGTAIAATTKAALSFDEGMAKVNTTAQLGQTELDGLKNKLIGLGSKYGAEMSAVPDGFEAILSVLGEVNPSLEVFETSLKGAKASGADLTVVSNALAKTKSILGEANVSADDVLNTFLAAKRVGAGEFSDFAAYMPGLISSANNLGVEWKQTAGLFAYMTGKVATAADATMLMQNVFTAFGKSDITGGLKAEGVLVFDEKGAMRQLDDIMGDLAKRMKGMSDEQKSNFLEEVGLKDAQAKQGISTMIADPEALKSMMGEVKNAQGEVEDALERSKNNMQSIREAWAKVMALGIQLGGVFTKVLAPALDAVGLVLDGLITGFGWMRDGIGWVKRKLEEGNPVMVITVGVLGSLATGLALAYLWSQRMVAMQAIKATWDAAVAISTGGWAAAQNWLNAMLWANPVALIIAGIVALIAVIGYVIYKTEGWGEAWQHVVTGSKLLFQAFVEAGKRDFNNLVDHIMIGINAIKAGWYGFKNAIGIGDVGDNNAMLQKIQQDTDRRKSEIEAANKKVADLSIRAAGEFKASWGSLKWDNTKTIGGGVKELQKKFGVNAPEVLVNSQEGGKEGSGKGGKEGSGKGGKAGSGKGSKEESQKDGRRKAANAASKTNEAIATGGTKNTTIHITIGKQIENLTVQQTGNIRESAQRVGDVFVDELTRAIQMAQSLAV